MKSIAAYYAFIAINEMDKEAAQRRAKAPQAPRPSLIARARALVTSRSSQPAATAA